MLEYSPVSQVHQMIIRAPKQERETPPPGDVTDRVSGDLKSFSSIGSDPLLLLVLVNTITSLIAIIISVIALVRK